MRLFTFTILCFVASAANADTTLFYREYSNYDENTIVEGGTLRFTLYADGSEPITIDAVIPGPPNFSAYFEILESDAATYGFDWSELESMVEGPKEQSTDFGPVGYIEHVDGLPPHLGGGWFDDVTLSRIRYFIFGDGGSFPDPEWHYAGVVLSGDFLVVYPEPSSAVLLLFALCGVPLRRHR